MKMLKGSLQWSVYPSGPEAYIQSGQCMLVLILPTPEGWKAEWTLAGKKVAQIFNLDQAGDRTGDLRTGKQRSLPLRQSLRYQAKIFHLWLFIPY